MTNLFLFLQSNQILTFILLGLISLSIGSFLNVVIYRLPKMIEMEQGSTIITHAANDEDLDYTLSSPGSHCPNCSNKIKFYDNIPLLSFLWLKGKCRYCKIPISWQYPLTEIITCILSIAMYITIDDKITAFCTILYLWFLIPLSIIDIQKKLLPDLLTYPLLWLGLLINTHGIFAPLNDAVLGAFAGYLSLWSVYHIFYLLTGKVGMGYGDFKLFAAVGAWLGWHLLPFVIFIAAFSGALFGIICIILTKRKITIAIPFGPFIAIASLICLLLQEKFSFFSLLMS